MPFEPLHSYRSESDVVVVSDLERFCEGTEDAKRQKKPQAVDNEIGAAHIQTFDSEVGIHVANELRMPAHHPSKGVSDHARPSARRTASTARTWRMV